MRATTSELLPSPNGKELGAYYTPEAVVRELVAWALHGDSDRHVLDPSCGDGRFLWNLKNAVGVDIDEGAVSAASSRVGRAKVVQADFFEWAQHTDLRFDAAVGNPPFIRYQRFRGSTRAAALATCRRAGVNLTALSSSWAPFIVGASLLLRAGGRIAFVVPAEVGHAVYARPLVTWLLDSFGRVELIAFREKFFSSLSEDCWLLRASGFGQAADSLHLACAESHEENADCVFESLSRRELRAAEYRIRPFLLPSEIRKTYERLATSPRVRRLGAIAKLGIGYVTGANDFFHLRPSQARECGIPGRFLRPTVRSSRDLANLRAVDRLTVERWQEEDRPMLLLALRSGRLPESVTTYLDSARGQAAREAYKCRNRDPWYVVPDVRVPSAFLSIMSGGGPRLVLNEAGAACTNSVHAVHFATHADASAASTMWGSHLTQLSCEVEGHALGGGMLKLEPEEARRVVLPVAERHSRQEREQLALGIRHMRRWRRTRDAN